MTARPQDHRQRIARRPGAGGNGRELARVRSLACSCSTAAANPSASFISTIFSRRVSERACCESHSRRAFVARPRISACCFSMWTACLPTAHIIVDDRGVETKHFHVRDGQGIALLLSGGIEVGFMTARSSPACGIAPRISAFASCDKACATNSRPMSRSGKGAGLAMPKLPSWATTSSISCCYARGFSAFGRRRLGGLRAAADSVTAARVDMARCAKSPKCCSKARASGRGSSLRSSEDKRIFSVFRSILSNIHAASFTGCLKSGTFALYAEAVMRKAEATYFVGRRFSFPLGGVTYKVAEIVRRVQKEIKANPLKAVGLSS